MNTFFYSAAGSQCDQCNYTTCSSKCLHLLSRLPVFSDIRVLQGGSCLKTTGSMELRSGDILLLYAGSRQDLDHFIAIAEFLDTFRIILIVGDDALTREDINHSLRPRYITCLQENMDQLGAVIARMSALPQEAAPPMNPQSSQRHSHA